MNDDPQRSSRPDAGLRIDPVRIGRPSVAPIAVAAVAMAFVAAAIVKPWQPPMIRVVAAPAPSARTTGVERLPSPVASANAMTQPDLAAAAPRREQWGIRALVLDEPFSGGSSVVGDDWQALALPAFAADPDPTLGLEQGIGTGGRPVLAVGITTPRDMLALDVRFWRLDGGAGQRRILAVPIPGSDAGSWLWLPDPRDATTLHGWPSGDYQIDVLAGHRVVHVVTHIEGDAAPPPRPTLGGVSAIPLLQALTTFPPGPFAVGPATIQPVIVDPGPPLDAADAWLGATTARGGGSNVGRIVGDPIVGVGALLEPGQTIITAELERVSPAQDMPAMRIVELPGVDGYGTSVGAAVTLVPPAGMALADGLYHLIVAIRGANGEAFSSTWTLEILPAEPPVRPGQALVQLRYFSVLHASNQERTTAPIVSEADLGGSDGDGTCGGAARVRTTDEMIGLITDPGVDVRDLRLVPIDTIRRVDVPIRFAAGVADGLTLVALPPGGIAARQYALIATIGAGSTQTESQYTVCVG